MIKINKLLFKKYSIYGPTADSIASGCSATNLNACKLSYVDEPTNWKSASFDDSTWSKATLFTEQQAGMEI